MGKRHFQCQPKPRDVKYPKSGIQPAAKPGNLSTTPLCGPRHILIHQSNMLTEEGELDIQTAHLLCPKESNHVSLQEISSFQSSAADENVWAVSSVGACPAAGECMQVLSYVNILVSIRNFFML